MFIHAMLQLSKNIIYKKQLAKKIYYKNEELKYLRLLSKKSNKPQ